MTRWFIYVKGFPYVSNVPPLYMLPWKKSNCILREVKTKASVQSFRFIIRRSLLQPAQSTLAPVAAGPTWSRAPEQESAQTHGVSALLRERETEKERERERVRAPLFPCDYISLGLGWTRCFFKRTNRFFKLLWALDRFTPLS